MTTVSAADLATILRGTEHGGDDSTIYAVAFAVPDRLLGVSESRNNSAFSFGVTQLDIGSNTLAQEAFTAILDDALISKAITVTEHDRLLSYEGQTRYDLDPALKLTYKADQALLDTKVFSQPTAWDIVDSYDRQYITQHLLGKVQGFIDAMTATWGDNSVFSRESPDFHTAVAAVTSIANRFGSLEFKLTTEYFDTHQPATISDVRARFDAMLPATHATDWQLVQTGAQLFTQADRGYYEIAEAISPSRSAIGDGQKLSPEAIEFHRWLGPSIGTADPGHEWQQLEAWIDGRDSQSTETGRDERQLEQQQEQPERD